MGAVLCLEERQSTNGARESLAANDALRLRRAQQQETLCVLALLILLHDCASHAVVPFADFVRRVAVWWLCISQEQLVAALANTLTAGSMPANG